MQKILFLTDFSNGNQEDLITIDYLKQNFEVTSSYFEGIESVEDQFDLIVIRNTWPSDPSKFARFNHLKKAFLERAKMKDLKVYNDLNACCDRLGKGYSSRLFEEEYPVIPTIDSLKHLEKLPRVDEYLLKPKDGFSSFGIKTIAHSELENATLDYQILQPKLAFEHEISFYFVDDKLLYALIFSPHKGADDLLVSIHTPSQKEIDFAMQFIQWNKMEYGASRIDVLRLKNGELLLLEIEDDSPCFALDHLNEGLKEKFLMELNRSIHRYLKD